MNYYFITGSSRGLGKSLTELLLKDKNNTIFGIARTNSINHERYNHTVVDMSNLTEVQSYQFPKLEDAE